jgi:hypothetical protein
VKGFKNILFGGEGLYLASLTGPGHVWLQSMPILNLAEEIARYLPSGGDTGASSTASGVAVGSALGVAGGILGGLLGGGNNDRT